MKLKSKIDEMQEQNLLRLESSGLNIAFLGLLASIVIQISMGASFRQVCAEWIVFMLLCLHMIVGCVRHGIWARTFTPSLKTNLIACTLAAIVVGAVAYAVSVHYELAPAFTFRYVLLSAAGVFLLCFVALTACAKLYQKRREKLDKE